ncbi:lectin-like [Styela clava]
MNLYIIGTICLFIIDTSLAGGDGHCYTKWKNGRWVSVGDCNNPSTADVLRQLKKRVKAKEFKGWYQASNGFYYKLFNDKVNYATAKSNCQKQGADLASAGVRNPTILSKIMPLIKAGNDHTWIGLKKLEGKFIWADGVDSNEGDTDWNAEEPSNSGGDEDCVHFWLYIWQLNDISCTKNMKYICEARA